MVAKYERIEPGEAFGRLTVVERAETRPAGNLVWLCECVCGQRVKCLSGNLRSGRTQSCGCYNQELRKKPKKLKHGMCLTAEYTVWHGMLSRCRNRLDPTYRNYGARGITVCRRWCLSFENFFADMGPRPSPSHTLDRFPDNNGNYEPGNVRWATLIEQANNKRTTRLITYEGTTLSVSQWSRVLGISPQGLFYRLSTRSVKSALTDPVKYQRKGGK